MPNGTRRGHQYHRNGRTYWRGPSKIAPPKAAFAVLVVGGGMLLAVGVPQAVVAGVAVVGIAAFLTLRSRSMRRKIGRRLDRWAMRHAVNAGRRKPEPPREVKARTEGATPAPPYRRPGSKASV